MEAAIATFISRIPAQELHLHTALAVIHLLQVKPDPLPVKVVQQIVIVAIHRTVVIHQATLRHTIL